MTSFKSTKVYELLLERTAERDLKKLTKTDFDRIIPHIKDLKETPRPIGCRKITGSKRDWRIRVGAYRIIYEVDDTEKVIRVMRVRHRKEAYL